MSDGNKSEEAICSLRSLRNFLEDMQAKRSPCYDHDLTGGYVAANIGHASKGAAYHLPGLRQAIDHLIEERLMTEEPERSELKAGKGEAGAISIALPDDDIEVVIYTEGSYFAREQFFHVRGSDLNPAYYDAEDPMREECQAATHWISADYLAWLMTAAPPAAADAVSVPVEQRELEWLEHWLLFASEPVGQECCNRPGSECCGCPDPCYRTADDIATEMHARHAELRALLAQSESEGGEIVMRDRCNILPLSIMAANKLRAVEQERDTFKAECVNLNNILDQTRIERDALRAQVEAMRVDADLYRQWFNAVQDLNPGYLERSDYQAAVRLLEALGQRVPSSVSDAALQAKP